MKTKEKSKTKKENLKKLERATHQTKLFKSENWGGKREGSGRKQVHVTSLKRKVVSFYLDRDEEKYLREQLAYFRQEREKFSEVCAFMSSMKEG